jgi:hypothetical protein
MMRWLLVAGVGLSGCAQVPTTGRDGAASAAVDPAPETAVLADPEADAPVVEASATPPAADGVLGVETVSLGDPAEAGLWVKTGLVTSEMPGLVRAGNGEAVAVTLRPLGGAGGPQISLAALQALGLPLTGLAPVTVARAG